eukprot:SAG22_NODE_1527_length_4219_cov_8.734466_1_plen_74_part_00
MYAAGRGAGALIRSRATPVALHLSRTHARAATMLPNVPTFGGDFTQPSVVPESANERVLELMRTEFFLRILRS